MGSSKHRAWDSGPLKKAMQCLAAATAAMIWHGNNDSIDLESSLFFRVVKVSIDWPGVMIVCRTSNLELS